MKNLILICGDEEYLKEQKKKELLKALNAEGSLNFNVFTNENIDLTEIRKLAETLPFFEPTRTILITDSGLFKKGRSAAAAELDDEDESAAGDGAADGNTAETAGAGAGAGPRGADPEKRASEAVEAFSELPDTTVVIFYEANVSATSPLFKHIKKQGEIFQFETADSKKGKEKTAGKTEIRVWAGELLKKEGRSIDGSTLFYLAELTGYDMQNLSTEIEKLLCYTMERPKGYKITREDVDAICSKTLSDRVFEMLENKMKGRPQKALELLEELYALRVSPMRILYMLVKQYNQALALKECQAEHMSIAQAAAKMDVKTWLLEKLADQTRRVSQEELIARLEACADMEYRIKRGDMNEKLALELLIIQ